MDRAEIASKVESNFKLRKRVNVCNAVERVLARRRERAPGSARDEAWALEVLWQRGRTGRILGLFIFHFFLRSKFFALIDTRTSVIEYVYVEIIFNFWVFEWKRRVSITFYEGRNSCFTKYRWRESLNPIIILFTIANSYVVLCDSREKTKRLKIKQTEWSEQKKKNYSKRNVISTRQNLRSP